MSYLLLAIIGALQTVGTERPAEISLLMGPRNYIERQYAAVPAAGADYLFLTGESVDLAVRFVNRTERTLTLVGPRGDLSQSMLSTFTRPQDGSAAQMEAHVVQDGTLELSDSTGQRDVRWDGRLELAPNATLSVPLRLAQSTKSLAGIYELRVTAMQAQCEPSCVVHNQGGLFRFEIRTTTNQPEQLDLLARRAFHAIDQSNFAEADGAIAEMLQLHPRSVIAYHLKARAAEERKDLKAAEDNYAVALSLLTNGQDALLPPARGIETHKLDAYFAQRIKAVQEARRKR